MPIALEPGTTRRAYAWYAYWHIFLVGQDWADHPKAMMERAGELAERAILLDPFDARGLSISGHVRAFLHRRLREAMALHERALSLNPNLAMAWALSAVTHAYAGDPDEAGSLQQPLQEAVATRSARILLRRVFRCLDPHDEAAITRPAVELDGRSSQLNPSFHRHALALPLAALGHLHRDQETTTIRRRLLALEPDFTIERFLETNPMASGTATISYITPKGYAWPVFATRSAGSQCADYSSAGAELGAARQAGVDAGGFATAGAWISTALTRSELKSARKGLAVGRVRLGDRLIMGAG